MDIVPDITKKDSVSQFEIEQVQLQKQEYYLLGTFLRTKGLNLFFYDPENDSVKEAKIKYSDTIHLYKLPDKFIFIDWESQKTTVEGRYIYFESLNLRSALHRVNRFKKGFIKELSNLRVPSKEGIKLY